MGDAAELRPSLDVVAGELVDRSRKEASQRRETAEARAVEILTEGRRRAEAIIGTAEAEGVRSAEGEAAHRLARGRREARRVVLGARRAAVDRLHTEVMTAIDELRRQPGYDQLEDGLADLAVAVLGADAEIERDPGGCGGVLARDGSRAVDLTLPSLAERCLRDLGRDVEGLWA